MPAFDKYDWMRRAPDYFETFKGGAAFEAQERAVLEALAPLTFETVMEFGCGFGRLTKRIVDAYAPRLYVATDLLADMLRSANEYLTDRDGDKVLLQQFDLDAGEDAGPVDLVICAEVLMHRRPEEIAADVAFLCATSRSYVVTVDWHGDRDRVAEGCWQHDYRALFAPYGTVEETLVPEARQAVYLTKLTRGIDD